MKPGEKLFLITRKDLPPGQQAVQATHAMSEFMAEFPDTYRRWYETSNTLALLATSDEMSLSCLIEDAQRRGFRCSLFREPDRGNEITAIALEPAAKRICRGFGLALRDL
jgi:hypothetical protein